MRTYTYVDNTAKQAVVFSCVAKTIQEADEQYTAATGQNPVKQSHIGCRVVVE